MIEYIRKKNHYENEAISKSKFNQSLSVIRVSGSLDVSESRFLNHLTTLEYTIFTSATE